MSIISSLQLYIEFFRYLDYEIVGSDDISKTASLKNRNSKKALQGLIVDIHFLSLSDHLVCTFSSQVLISIYFKKIHATIIL